MRDHYWDLIAKDDEARIAAIEMSRYEDWLDEKEFYPELEEQLEYLLAGVADEC